MIKLLLNILIIFAAGSNSAGPDIKNYLDKNLSGYASYDYEVVSLPKGINDPEDKRLSINDEVEFKVNNSFGYIPVEINYTQGFSLKSYITVKLTLFKDVFVAERKISKGEYLTSSDFRKKIKEVTYLKDDVFEGTDKIESYKANIRIDEGSVLQKYMLKQIPLIERGNTLTAYNISGSVSISFSAKAYENGNKGDVIRIINDKNQYFNALILDSERVKIIE